MTVPLFEPPPSYGLPLVKGGDLHVVFVYKPVVTDDDGEPILANGKYQYEKADYPAGATVKLIIETNPVQEFDADISGPNASVSVDHLITDEIDKNIDWRVILTYADGLDEVLANGRTFRKDR